MAKKASTSGGTNNGKNKTGTGCGKQQSGENPPLKATNNKKGM